ncbi:MAG: transglutaminase domain-containing protein, partial [Clostridia bacterium]|nr:transglutaminase domain-containing protein [Clostridia bacterium]
VEAKDRIVESTGYALDSVSYFFTDVFGIGDVRTGYGELTDAGGNFTGSPKTELVLYTNEKPYIIFEDESSKKLMKRRRNLYLEGGKGVDKEELVDFLQMLYSQEVSKETAHLFSQISKVRVEYAFLRTKDEIAPRGSLYLTSGGRSVEGGSGKKIHRKGYSLQAEYLDIDYGSPYLIYIIKKAQEQGHVPVVSYDDLRLYARDIYMLDLREIMSEDEYYEIIGKEKAEVRGEVAEKGSATDSEGVSDRLKELSRELTDNLDSDYDKCRAVEEYVRQYTYSLQVPKDGSKKVDMTSLEEMSALADTFLFETGKGYCVHFASAMISILEIAGIPARAAGGYCYLYPFEEQESYNVSGNCAHTWVEAYIENVGWVPFEPTSAYYTATSLSWNKVAQDDRVKKSSDVDKKERMNVPVVPAFDESMEAGSAENNTRKILVIAGIVTLSIAVLFALIIIINLITRKLRYKYGTPQQKLCINVEELKRLIRKKSGENFRERGLLSDYVKRAPDEYQADIEKVFMAFYALEYGPSKDSLTILEAANTARGIITELK